MGVEICGEVEQKTKVSIYSEESICCHVELRGELARYLESRVKSGYFSSLEEAIRDAVRKEKDRSSLTLGVPFTLLGGY